MLYSDLMSERGSCIDTAALSLESQMRLRELYSYVDNCRAMLDEISTELAWGRMDRVPEKLERFCFEADGWGFDALYKVAAGLHSLVVDHGARKEGIQEALDRGLEMLSALIEQCGCDFQWRLAVADVLECFDRAR